jgi:hypothetical protein
VTRLVAVECGCFRDYYSGKRPEKCECGNRLRSPAELAPPKERAPLRRVSLKRQDEEASGERRSNRTGSTLKPGRGFAAAPAQQWVKDLACIVCGRDRHEIAIDAAHVTPRRLAPHCDCARGVVPLCRDCHERYDDLNRPFDLLPYLMAHGLLEEAVHGFLEHGVALRELMDVITGDRFIPLRELELAQARIIELEGGVRA